MKKVFTLVITAAMLGSSVQAASVYDVLSDFTHRGYDTSLSGGIGDWSDEVAPNRFTFEVVDGVDLSTSTTAKVSLYYGDKLLISQGTTGNGIDLWLGEFSVDFYSEIQTKEAGNYSLVIDDDFLTLNGVAVTGGKYEYTYGNVVSTPLVEDLLTLVEARAWDSTADGGFGAVSTKIANNSFSFEVADGVELSSSATAKISLYLGQKLLASATPTSSNVDLWLGEFTIDFYDVMSEESGLYRLIVDEGFFVQNGVAVSGGVLATQMFEGNGGGGDEPGGDEVDFTYTLDPASGESIEKPTKFELTFTAYAGENKVEYCQIGNAVATVQNADGSVVKTCYWPDIQDNKVIMEFGTDDTVWPAGEYTLTIYPNMLAVDIPDYKVNEEGNFEGLTATYTVTGFVPNFAPLEDHLTLTFPASLECTNVTTATEEYPEGGMLLFKFDVKGNISVAPQDSWPDWIQLIYTGEDGVDSYFTYNPFDPERFDIVTKGVNNEGEMESEWVLHSDVDPDWGMSVSMYQQPGQYTLIFPQKTFYLDGEPMAEAKFVFHYSVDTTKVAAIDAAESYTVYTIDGRMVYAGDDVNALSALEAGVYIINGKKVLLTK
ncbi:MAG: hypothetical protein K2H86_04720 [Muribaculaceae bacterium]|nr:hypothetical protein [Muribaculaceae bacterium]